MNVRELIQVQVQKLSEDAELPEYATDGSGCFDIRAYIGKGMREGVNDTRIFHTGLAFEVPEGYVMKVYSRSGMGFKSDVRLANCVGIIDSDYRGELMIKLTNDNPDEYFFVNHGDRIAQGMIIPVPKVEFLEIVELSETKRGLGGLGSTGLSSLDLEFNKPYEG